MTFDIVTLIRATGTRRASIEIRDISVPKTFANELFALYRPIVQRWEAARSPIMSAYGQTIVGLTTDAPADIEQVIKAAADELERLFLVLTPRLKDWAVRVERWHRTRWIANVLSASGIDLDTMLTANETAETVDTVIRRNVALIRDVSAQAQGRISDAVFRGVQQRKPAVEVAREVRAAVTMSRRRSILIASDQATKLTSALDTERMKQAGIEKWKWMWSHKLHGRAAHIARDGKIYSFDDPPPDMPGELPYCGCRKLAVIDLD